MPSDLFQSQFLNFWGFIYLYELYPLAHVSHLRLYSSMI